MEHRKEWQWMFCLYLFLSVSGAFLVPYFIAYVICGIPLLYMELTVGQLTRRGPIGALGKLCPLLKGKYAHSKKVSQRFMAGLDYI